jgi:hypothetical protein
MNRRWFRWWWLLLIVLAVVGLTRLRFDVEVLNLLPPELPVVQGLKLYQRHFANADELILTVHSDDAALAESVARQLALSLRAQTNLVARALWQAPAQEHPEQMAELLAALWLNQPPETFSELTARLSEQNVSAALTAAREALATSL